MKDLLGERLMQENHLIHPVAIGFTSCSAPSGAPSDLTSEPVHFVNQTTDSFRHHHHHRRPLPPTSQIHRRSLLLDITGGPSDHSLLQPKPYTPSSDPVFRHHLPVFGPSSSLVLRRHSMSFVS
ncbi:hypothetical protein PIB30_054767 [Stylosanthes scabra]|uniref:Uncharacterized protein n=1 Tax=Stylosanthes scabra TaxID=79078 RepID=A0ABU6YHR6_9FABA|nr:hypothetical protein [Stylosanthes scabra]